MRYEIEYWHFFLKVETPTKYFFQFNELCKKVISDKFDKLLIGINEVLVFSVQGGNGDFFMHIYEELTSMMDLRMLVGKRFRE